MNLFGNMGKKIKGYRSLIFRFQAEKIHGDVEKVRDKGLIF